MQLIEVPAKTGYVWFRQGIWLFRKNPLAFLTLFFAYLLATMLIAQVPLIGSVLPLLFVPGVAVGFMAACRDTIAGKPVFPTALVDGFRSYGGVAARRLIVLGAVYLVAFAAVVACSAIGDGGKLLHLFVGSETIDPETIPVGDLLYAFLAMFACYLPVAMLFWFAPIVTAWHDVPPVKAMFFSVVSCWRNRGAFLVYGALWCSLAVVILLGLPVVMELLGAGDYSFAIVMPAWIIFMTMLYCSVYATYRGCFGVQTPNATPEPPVTPPER
ncbi:BPSS1780 family membrane protein [Paraburkholderia phosphatilytica]|uniref:BPSS1780 family membrane protein n=1 Tax=Paraburkholderia phosphatilytica TaxID=2282883 RepID=UPI000E530ACD|nr:BPSS1780 family membrane protein [Paraburkholderia phosphatilytica]